MGKTKYLLFVIFLILFSRNAMAIQEKNSCLANPPGDLSLVGNIASLGILGEIQNRFDMLESGAEGELTDDPYNQNSPQIARCAVPTNDIKFCYTPILADIGLSSKTCRTMTNGDRITVADILPVFFIAEEIEDKLCVKTLTSVGYTTLGCKYRPSGANAIYRAACYVGDSCISDAASHSRMYIPISSYVVECVKQTVKQVFNDPAICGGTGSRSNLFPEFQNAMRSAVLAALTLYVIFFGMKIGLSNEPIKKGDVFMFVIKAILVVFFSIGFGPITSNPASPTPENGVNWIYNAFITAGESLANIIFQAGGASGLCEFLPQDYEPGHEYLALWDSLDCRILFYLGLNNADALINNTLIYIAQVISTYAAGVLMFIFAFHWIYLMLLIIFFIMFLSTAVYVVHTFLISLIAITIVVYLAPLFVPLALFKQTKSYFDNWVKLLFAYTLQPVLLFAFLALMLSTFDNVLYPKCEFKKTEFYLPSLAPAGNVTIESGLDSSGSASVGEAIGNTAFRAANFRYVQLYSLKPADEIANPEDKETCETSFGYQLSATKDNPTDVFHSLFFTFTMWRDLSIVENTFTSLIAAVIFVFLFYHFNNMIGGLAADLTGGGILGATAIGPNQITDAVVETSKKLIKAALDAKTGGAATKAETMMKIANRQVGEQDSGSITGLGKGSGGGSSGGTGGPPVSGAGGGTGGPQGAGSGAKGASGLPTPPAGGGGGTPPIPPTGG